MIQGKQLITVENVGNHKTIHPVQQAMVDTDGSQCGYCTPGFIMSLFYLYKTENNPDRETINDVLTGNLCRCTGYRSIVEAAARSCVNGGIDHFNEKEKQVIELLKEISSNLVNIETTTQRYFRVTALNEVLGLKENHPNALLLSGATDIGLRVTKSKELLPEIIDLSGISELQQISEDDESVTIGAGVNLEEVRQLSKNNFPAMYDMLSVFGSRQIRYLGTLGGNLGSASPIGDIPPVLMAYDATITLESVDGKREIKALNFITGYRKTQIQTNEIIAQITIPKLHNGTIVKSYKVSKRKDLDISTVSAGFRLDLDENDHVKDIKLIYGGMAAMTKRAEKAEQFLTGKKWERSTVEEAMNLVDAEFTPISDARSGAEARRVMARNLLLKFWSETKNNHQ